MMRITLTVLAVFALFQVTFGQLPEYTEFKHRPGTVITEALVAIDSVELICRGDFRLNILCEKIRLTDEHSQEELIIYNLADDRPSQYLMFGENEVEIIEQMLRLKTAPMAENKYYATLDPGGFHIIVTPSKTILNRNKEYNERKNCLLRESALRMLISTLHGL